VPELKDRGGDSTCNVNSCLWGVRHGVAIHCSVGCGKKRVKQDECACKQIASILMRGWMSNDFVFISAKAKQKHTQSVKYRFQP